MTVEPLLNDFDPTRDLGKRRVIPFDKNELIIQAREPYGMWGIHFLHGPIPEMLEGLFTSPEEAEKAARVYLATRQKILKKA